LLAGFDFNANGTLDGTLKAVYTATIDRFTGALDFSVERFIPENELIAPFGATHYKIVSGGAEIDFEAGTFVSQRSETAILPWDMTLSAPVSQTNNVTAGSTKVLLLVAGVVFYQEVNGQMYPFKAGESNPLRIVAVSGL
jgi:hypothetical protein